MDKDAEWILKYDSIYSFHITSAGADNNITVQLQWYKVQQYYE